MSDNSFEFGPISRGIYNALLCFTALVALFAPSLLVYYLPFVLFLGLGLRPIMNRTGLYRLFQGCIYHIEEKRDRKFLQKRRGKLERKKRDQKYRNRHKNDPRLPKNW